MKLTITLDLVNKRGISLRYKILALMTLIPVITLAIYLLLALKIFEEDKIAYVFDSTSNVAGTLATQVKTELNSLVKTCKPILQDFVLTRQFGVPSQSVFSNETSISSILVLTEKSDGTWERVSYLEKEPELATHMWNGIVNDLPILIPQINSQGRTVKFPFQDERVFVFEKIQDEVNKQKYIFIIVAREAELAEMFKSVSVNKMYLVNSEGKIFFGPESEVGRFISENFKVSFVINNEKKLSQGVETSIDKGGVQQLISFSKVGVSDLYVISSVAKSKALAALQILLRKSLIFFGILICVTVTISLFASNTLTSALTVLFEATKKVSEGNFDFKVHINSNDEVGTLALNFNRMSAEVARLLEETAQKARMESELQTAKTVQETLFPKTDFQIGQLEISGFYESASECGGDWWHYNESSEKIFLWIGDATGHGVPAALITSAAKSAATIIENLDVSPSVAMHLLNLAIHDVSKGKLMMTFFVASFDPKRNKLVYANASHEAPFLIRKSDAPIKKKDLIPLNDIVSPRLGQSRDTNYEEVEIDFNPGDLLFLYTDGIPDIQNPQKEAWGEREFVKTIVKAGSEQKTSSRFRDLFVESFQSYRKDTVLIDDVTFFIVKNNLKPEVNNNGEVSI